MTKPRYLAAVLACLTAVLAVSCGSGESETEAAAETPVTEPATDTSNDLSTEAAASALTVQSVSGSQIDFGSLEGKDAVLWFWAPW